MKPTINPQQCEGLRSHCRLLRGFWGRKIPSAAEPRVKCKTIPSQGYVSNISKQAGVRSENHHRLKSAEREMLGDLLVPRTLSQNGNKIHLDREKRATHVGCSPQMAVKSKGISRSNSGLGIIGYNGLGDEGQSCSKIFLGSRGRGCVACWQPRGC